MKYFLIPLLIPFAMLTAWIGTKLSAVLPEIHRHFDHKPFNCRPCLSFHITWIPTTICATFLHSHVLQISSILVAIVQYLILRNNDNKKIVK